MASRRCHRILCRCPTPIREAPKGGTIVFGETGGFDSLNPYILKGRAPAAIQSHVFETLMARNWDEPFGLYGLLAESIETGPEREWVEFTLRPEATVLRRAARSPSRT